MKKIYAAPMITIESLKLSEYCSSGCSFDDRENLIQYVMATYGYDRVTAEAALSMGVVDVSGYSSMNCYNGYISTGAGS